MLIRPDGHVAWVGDGPQEGCSDVLTAWFGGEGHARVEGDARAGGAGHEVPLWSILLVLGLAAFVLEGALLA